MGQNAVMAYVMGLRLAARPGTTPDGMPKSALTSEPSGRPGEALPVSGVWQVKQA